MQIMRMMSARQPSRPSRRGVRPRAGRWGVRLGVGLSLSGLLAAAAALLPMSAAEPAAAARGGASGGDPGSPELLQALPGFKIERTLKADGDKNGSWISMAKDSKGRLLLGGQARQPFTRVTIKDGKVAKEEILDFQGVTEAMGILEAYGSLYVNGQRSERQGNQTHTKFGLWKLTSSDGGENYNHVELLREWQGGSGEHGAHAVLAGPDKKIYVVCGNFVHPPEDLSPQSPHRNYADDLALPRAEDGNGFGAGKKPPGGFVCRMDPDGKNAELFAAGERNDYDVAFNADGELLGFDSDMEWDWGTPWYRPIRVFHAPSGADQGFREGTAKWPEYYADGLPAVVPVGVGCPTGVVFGYGAKFPAAYQKAFYVLDWTYGRLIAVHLKPKGASYEATWENFVEPKGIGERHSETPLNLTDAVVGDDGALYFTIGGRGTQAALYRVTYAGTESTAPVDPHDADGADARALRHKLEAFQGKQDPKAIEAAWPNLGNADRFIRYAARLAIESQPVAEWKSKALEETNPQAALTALLALARLGGPEAQADVLKALEKISITALPKPQQLEKLRVLEVSIARQGKPSGELAKPVLAELGPMYPANDVELNRELCQVLLALDAPEAVSKSVALLKAAPTQEEQLTYILALRTIKDGWTPELRREYFSWWAKDHSKVNPEQHPAYVVKWFEEAGRSYDNGSSFAGFVRNLRNDALGTLSAEQKSSLEDVLALYTPPGPRAKKPSKVRKPVKAWTMGDLEPLLSEVGHGRNFEKGKEAFDAAQCAACHKFGNEGGAVGPELTAVSSRYSRKDILESIILPSKVISEQYAATTFRLKDGDVVEGRVMEENDERVVVQPNPLVPAKTEVKKSEIKSRGFSKVSPMPEGLLNTFTKDEILDLLAYVESGGRKDHPDFKN